MGLPTPVEDTDPLEGERPHRALMSTALPALLTIESTGPEGLVLAAPITGDPYYEDVADDIFDFHVEYARQIEGRDDLLILVDKGAYDRYAEALGEDRVVLVPMADIWVRDYGLSNAKQPIMFRYTAAGQGGRQEGAT